MAKRKPVELEDVQQLPEELPVANGYVELSGHHKEDVDFGPAIKYKQIQLGLAASFKGKSYTTFDTQDLSGLKGISITYYPKMGFYEVYEKGQKRIHVNKENVRGGVPL